MLRLPCTSAIGDPDYARVIALLIWEERENSAHVGPLLPERARQDHQNSNSERCLFDARTIQEMAPVCIQDPSATVGEKHGLDCAT